MKKYFQILNFYLKMMIKKEQNFGFKWRKMEKKEEEFYVL